MLARTAYALIFGLLATFATTRSTYAADFAEKQDMVIGAFIGSVALMVLIFAIYLVRHAFGLDAMPPPEPDAGDHGAHH